MSDPSDNSLKRLIGEIHRRSLWQVLGIYLVGAWAALQVIDTLEGIVILPEWFGGLAIGFLILGLPVVLATAFVQHGGDFADVSEAPASTDEPTVPARLFTWRNAVIGGVGALALWGLLAAGWLLLGDRASPSVGDSVTTAGTTLGSLTDDRPSVAVLPLENLSGDPEDQAFTDGMHDEIQGRLSKIGGLRVIAREAVMGYEDATQPLQEIAEDLRVGSLVTGTVRRAANQVRISVQLVDPGTGENVWTEDYDRELSPEEIFDIWTQVAEEIAEALDTELTSEEQLRVAARPTESDEAYEYFLLGESLRNSGGWAEASEAYVQATEADPAFIDAWSELAGLSIQVWWSGRDRTEERLRTIEESLDRAGALDDTHPRYLAALGDHAYYVLEDYQQAEEAHERAVGADPNLFPAWFGLGFTRRRLGDFTGANEAFSRAEALNLRSFTTRQIAVTHGVLRNWDEANAAEARSRILNPADLGAWMSHGTILYRQGAVAEARADIERVITAGYSGSRAPEYLSMTYIAERRFDEARSILESPEHRNAVSDEVMHSRDLAIARVLDLANRSEDAREYYQAAREWLEAQLAEEPDHAAGHSVLALALAGLGDRDAAIEAGLRALELRSIEKDAFGSTRFLDRLAAVYAKVGETDAAIGVIEDLLSRPSFMTVQRLEMEPDWDPLRDHPRFQALLELYG